MDFDWKTQSNDRSASNTLDSCHACIHSLDQHTDLWCPFLSRTLGKDEPAAVMFPTVCKHYDTGPATGLDSAFVEYSRKNSRWVSREDFEAGYKYALTLFGVGEPPEKKLSGREFIRKQTNETGHYLEPAEFALGCSSGAVPF